MTLDVLIIGGGVVGASVAYHLSNYYEGNFALLEKEKSHALHTSNRDRNSGTLHDGATEYFKKGTKRYEYAPIAASKMIRYAADLEERTGTKILKKIGKFIVEYGGKGHKKLEAMEKHASELGFDVEILDREGIREIEPSIVEGRKLDDEVFALYHANAHIIDSSAYVDSLVDSAKSNDVKFQYNQEVVAIIKDGDDFVVRTDDSEYRTKYIVNCAGMHAITIANKMNVGKEFTLIPVRGDFYEIVGDLSKKIKSLIYQFPDTPFALQHVHPNFEGKIHAGPLAVVVPGMEWYKGKTKNSPVENKLYLREIFDSMFSYMGFYKLLLKKDFWKIFINEAAKAFLPNYFAKRLYLRDARRLIPSLKLEDLKETKKSGIRAQPLDKNGNFIHDIDILEEGNSTHYFSPSPALSLSMHLGDLETERIGKKLDLKIKELDERKAA